MREPNNDQTLALYESHPPKWLPKTHGSADLGWTNNIVDGIQLTRYPGYPGFHPPRPGQEEDILSEVNVKNGFVLQHLIAVSLMLQSISLVLNHFVGRDFQCSVDD